MEIRHGFPFSYESRRRHRAKRGLHACIRRLHQDLEIEADVNKEASLIEYAPKACAEKQPDWGTFESTTQRLESFRSHIQRLLKSFADARLNIEALGKLALGDLPSSMGEESRRQQMKDLAESLRVHRRRELGSGPLINCNP